MASYLSDKARYALATKQIDFANDVFKIILMASGFTFNRATHSLYADVSASELANGNGYTTAGAILAGISVTENNTSHLCEITWNNATWTASGGIIGPSPGAIIYDDTLTATYADLVIGYIDFGGNRSEPDGGIATITTPKVTV